jgi:hypothetical protein
MDEGIGGRDDSSEGMDEVGGEEVTAAPMLLRGSRNIREIQVQPMARESLGMRV